MVRYDWMRLEEARPICATDQLERSSPRVSTNDTRATTPTPIYPLYE